MQADIERFPSGIRALADFVHSIGLQFGIYEDYGTETCAGYPGVLGHLEQDAKSKTMRDERELLRDIFIVSFRLVDCGLFEVRRLQCRCQRLRYGLSIDGTSLECDGIRNRVFMFVASLSGVFENETQLFSDRSNVQSLAKLG